MNTSTCEACGASLDGKRADARWCSSACRMRAKRRESRLEFLRGILGGAAELRPVQPAHNREADARFRAMLAASQAAEEDRAARRELERTWREFERRNPGVEAPGRTQDRVQRLAAEAADRAPRFTVPTPGELGRTSRQSAPIRMQQAGPIEWDDNDPDLMEPPQMIDAGNWRSGRRW